jgi:hypothetical protein
MENWLYLSPNMIEPKSVLSENLNSLLLVVIFCEIPTFWELPNRSEEKSKNFTEKSEICQRFG